MKMTTEQMIQLYMLAVEEMREATRIYHARIVWFTSILTAVLAATVAGLVKSSAWYEYLIMLVGPGLIIGVSRVARHAIDHCYEVFLISVTARAKYEQLLGLTGTPEVPLQHPSRNPYWVDEPIVPSAHIESRTEYPSSSAEWIAARLKGGDQTWATRFFTGAEVVGWILLAATLVLSKWNG
jgi:hypothetical protein